mmetsp:Transcript_36170/g.95114  ORF Transcript_36170/g.95114 Transcript_36170/m.95114 type:complete len:113 (-) Transcript_36170:30-368(-)
MGKKRYMWYCIAQVLGAIIGAMVLKLALPPAMDETPFTTTGSLSLSHPFQVFFLEFICTFGLVYVFFAGSVDRNGSESATPTRHIMFHHILFWCWLSMLRMRPLSGENNSLF